MAATTRLIALGAAALVLAACSTSSSTSLDSDSAPKGNPATYQRINELSDCVALQAEFDRFDRMHGEFIASSDLTNAQVATDYMDAVDKRMRSVGCYS